MAATEWEWRELMMMLVRIQKELTEFSKRVDYPLGNASGIAYQLASIIRETRMGVKNGTYDSSYVGQKNRTIRVAVEQFEFRLRNDLERAKKEVDETDAYSVNES